MVECTAASHRRAFKSLVDEIEPPAEGEKELEKALEGG